MTILAVVNQKGGVGKTTTTAALGVLLARQGRGVHLVDMDHQADLTSAFGRNDPEGLLYEALTKRGPLPVVQVGENLTLTPSSIDLARGETSFVAEVGREYLLRTCLAKAKLPTRPRSLSTARRHWEFSLAIAWRLPMRWLLWSSPAASRCEPLPPLKN